MLDNLDDAIFDLYRAVAKLTSAGTYLYWCFHYLSNLDLCAFLGWAFIAGPFISYLAGTVWPLFLLILLLS